MAVASEPEKRALRILLAQPRGFCAGVERAIATVERALALHGAPVYVRHEIVHNKRVVENLKRKGARFVEEVDEIPPGAVTVFSAHGVAERVESDAAKRRLRTVDATCPLVSKVHQEGRRYAEKGFEVVLIGHAGHPEVVGTMGRIPGRVHLVGSIKDVAALRPRDASRIAYVTQTTLSLDDTRDIIAALRARFPAIVGPDTRDICYATQNRQIAVRDLAQRVDLLLVVGARNSSNSNRLREIGEASRVPSYLIEDSGELDPKWLEGVSTVGISAGASAPEELVQELLDRLTSLFATHIETLFGVEERVQFRLPDEVTLATADKKLQEIGT
jgi:4-hydroxy-3-methylbut-2-enyl diphosphate reductase